MPWTARYRDLDQLGVGISSDRRAESQRTTHRFGLALLDLSVGTRERFLKLVMLYPDRLPTLKEKFFKRLH
jgi:hypothetical protein